jgi:hypothetical protein
MARIELNECTEHALGSGGYIPQFFPNVPKSLKHYSHSLRRGKYKVQSMYRNQWLRLVSQKERRRRKTKSKASRSAKICNSDAF